MTIYTLHSLTFSRLEIHRDSEPIAIMECKGSFFSTNATMDGNR